MFEPCLFWFPLEIDTQNEWFPLKHPHKGTPQKETLAGEQHYHADTFVAALGPLQKAGGQRFSTGHWDHFLNLD